jgi:hypothetical protein
MDNTRMRPEAVTTANPTGSPVPETQAARSATTAQSQESAEHAHSPGAVSTESPDPEAGNTDARDPEPRDPEPRDPNQAADDDFAEVGGSPTIETRVGSSVSGRQPSSNRSHR